MLYRDELGFPRIIKPKSKDQVFLLCKPDSGRTESGIILEQHEDYPITQGFIVDFPLDRSYIREKYFELYFDAYVLFKRYANTPVVKDHYYNLFTDILTIDQIYTICVDDIICIFEKDLKNVS